MNAGDDVDLGRPPADDFRREAERRLRNKNATPVEAMAEVDVRSLLHELQVHQIELEMQNEELLRAQTAVQEVSDKYRDLFDFAPVGYFSLDRRGRVLEVNLAGAAMLGLDRSTAVKQRFGQFVAMENRVAFAEFCKRVLATDTQQTCEVKLLGTAPPVSVLIEGISAPDHQGRGKFCRAAVIDVTPQKRADELAAANQALVKAKAAAEAANVAKSRFLANMSHELRTPMNAILGMIDVALPKATDPTVQDCLQTAKGSAKLLLTLLNDLLDSAKIESGKLELESAPFSLRRMLDQITHVLSARASENGLSFFCSLSEATPDAVVGDRMKLQQVLLNLAGNAIKFTEHGEVEVSVRAVGGLCTSDRPDGQDRQSVENSQPVTSDPFHQILHPPSPAPSVILEFAVRDTGIGISPSSQEHLFQPFNQADASMTRRFGGTGLGLSISKGLVEMMGGRIWVESELGKGSTFYFTVCLPLAREHPADFEAPLAASTAICAPLRILLVEDNPANQKLAAYILRDRGHFVEIADDGQKAIRLTEQTRFDVILMDVQMPEMNGFEATAAIRERALGGRRIPIIAVTAFALKGDRERCLAAGMDTYISKPIQRGE
ncbi:MAG: ATP-binding protein, partial [Thermoguttaceae bacterium]